MTSVGPPRSATELPHKEPLYALLADGMERQIKAGILPSGLTLRSYTIARHLDISRAPVRAALEILEQRGHIEASGPAYRVTGSTQVTTTEVAASSYVPVDVEEKIQHNGAAWQQIFGDIEAVIAAAIPFGSFRISEAKITEAYGVSRTVIRDVMSRLEERGLVSRPPRGGCICLKLDEDRIEEIYEARLLIEPYVLQQVAPNLDRQWVRDCINRIEAVQASYPDVQPSVLEDLETDLHITAYAGFENDILKKTIESTRLLLVSTTQAFKRTLGLPDHDPFLADHHKVFSEILSGSPEHAASALRSHLTRARGLNIDRFRALAHCKSPELPTYFTPLK